MSTLRLDDLKQYSDVLRARNGDPVKVRFVEPRDAEELQHYFRSLSTRSRYNRFFGAMSELPHNVLDRFIHVGERDEFSVIATMSIEGLTPSSAKRVTPFIPKPKRSNSASRSTTAGRARASARHCCATSNAARRRSVRTACSATRCVPIRRCRALPARQALRSAPAPTTGSWCVSPKRSTGSRKRFPALAGVSPLHA